MKSLFNFLVVASIVIFTFLYHEQITDFIINKIIAPKETVEYKANNYTAKNNYGYLQINDSFFPKTRQDIMNIFYTRLDQGVDEFYFYCEEEYPTCINDVKEITNNQSILSEINNFLHPYNSYNKLSIAFESFGKIKVNITKLYSNEEITIINQKVDEIINSYINDNMTTRDKIKAIHDYIINTTKYDSKKAEAIKNGNPLPTEYEAQKAYGPLIQGMAICGGYSDAMAIFLDKLGIANYKVASSNHVWNLVYINSNWYHLDLTWDDPVTADGTDTIIYDFFLINTASLHTLDLTQHQFNANVYQEAN